MIPNILSIAGSDPSGGAGIQADIKSISANGGYAMAAITALTAQNTRGVDGAETVAPAFLAQQIASIRADIRIDAVKIGMVATGALIETTVAALAGLEAPIVLDPVMVAKGGDRLLAQEAVAALRDHLVPHVDVITPNLPEAADLLGVSEAQTPEDMEAQAQALADLGARAVLLKGGHLAGAESPDLLFDGAQMHWFSGRRSPSKNTHGTGCTLSSALATQLGHGQEITTAVRRAKTYVAGAIGHAETLSVGGGHGPTHHFFDLWRTP